MKRNTNGLRTWIDIDKKAISCNYRQFRKLVPLKIKLMSVVKSNAYGHDLVPFAKEMKKQGADYFGVDTAVEGLALREAGIKTPILVLGHTLPGLIKKSASKNISITVSNFEILNQIAKAIIPVSIHIKADTGMHRQGFFERDIPKVLRFLNKNKNIKVEGLYTHFAKAKNPAFPQYTQKQLKNFNKWIEEFKKAGYKPIVHASATSGTILFPEAHFDMVRVGIGMYGLWPSEEVRKFAHKRLLFKPALSWKTVVGEVKDLPKGVGVGYDLTETTQKKTRIAVCPIGYWHGFPRALSSVGYVLVGGKRVRVIGRISMDMIVVNVSGIKKVKAGSEVVLIGKQGKEEISAAEIAKLADTVNYEIITQLNPRIKRFFI